MSMIRVKVLMKSPPGKDSNGLVRRFPGGNPVWGRCQFLFDINEQDYDWLVVYDELPVLAGERVGMWRESLPCSRDHTLLVTVEPSSIKCYGRLYTRQFGHVLTSQEPWALAHPHAVYSQPALMWFYGRDGEVGSWDRMVQHPPEAKTQDVSTVCSSKQQKHTLHYQRYQFVQELKQWLPQMEVYGHGVRPMDDKSEALDAYRYHVAIENHVCQHHWTEKLSDAFLGNTLPFYYGCPNAADYFPEDSFIPIDLSDPAAVAERIKQAIRDGEYEKRLPAIREARRLVLEEYGFFAVVSRMIEERHHDGPRLPGGEILSRRGIRKASLSNLLVDLWEKYTRGLRRP